MARDNKDYWWQQHVDVILNTLVNENVPFSDRVKALAIMSIVNSYAGEYGKQSGLTASDIATMLGCNPGVINPVVRRLEEIKLIQREHDGSKGNRKVIVPLDPRKT